MSGDREEQARVFGIPGRALGPRARQGDEPKRVLGFPVETYGQLDWDDLRSLIHPIKAYKRWALIRRLGPYAPDDDDPGLTR